MTPESEPLLAFPCEFPIKVMGRAQPHFEQTLIALVRRHAPEFDPASVEVRSSREGTYLSLTLLIHAQSREQLDELYRELCDHPMVSMVL